MPPLKLINPPHVSLCCCCCCFWSHHQSPSRVILSLFSKILEFLNGEVAVEEKRKEKKKEHNIRGDSKKKDMDPQLERCWGLMSFRLRKEIGMILKLFERRAVIIMSFLLWLFHKQHRNHHIAKNRLEIGCYFYHIQHRLMDHPNDNKK